MFYIHNKIIFKRRLSNHLFLSNTDVKTDGPGHLEKLPAIYPPRNGQEVHTDSIQYQKANDSCQRECTKLG